MTPPTRLLLALLCGPQNSCLTIFVSEPRGHPVGLRYKYQFIHSASQRSMLPCLLMHRFSNGGPGAGDGPAGPASERVFWRLCVNIGWCPPLPRSTKCIEADCRFSVKLTVFSCTEPIMSNQPFSNQSRVFPLQMTKTPNQTAVVGRLILPLETFMS